MQRSEAAALIRARYRSGKLTPTEIAFVEDNIPGWVWNPGEIIRKAREERRRLEQLEVERLGADRVRRESKWRWERPFKRSRSMNSMRRFYAKYVDSLIVEEEGVFFLTHRKDKQVRVLLGSDTRFVVKTAEDHIHDGDTILRLAKYTFEGLASRAWRHANEGPGLSGSGIHVALGHRPRRDFPSSLTWTEVDRSVYVAPESAISAGAEMAKYTVTTLCRWKDYERRVANNLGEYDRVLNPDDRPVVLKFSTTESHETY